MQHTVFAPTQADLLYLLALPEVGILVGGQPAPGMGYVYRGPWSIAGAAMASEHALIWWIEPAADETETARREAVLQELRTRSALYEGVEHPTALLGTSGPSKPTDHDLIGVIRDTRRQRAGVKVGNDWFHSDPASRDLYNQGASQIALGGNPAPQPWKTMQGTFVLMTKDLLLQVLQALSVMDSAYHVIAETARAELAAGTLTDVHAIQWPAGFGDPT